MKFTDSISINAPINRVWGCVSSPDVWPRLYGKRGKCHQVSPDGGVVGSLYDMELGSGAGTTLIRCEIMGLRPGSMIVVKWTMSEDVPYISGWSCHFTHELTDEAFGTKVVERVEMTDFNDPRIRFAVNLVGWLTHRFRRLTGKTYLRKLKSIVEGG